MTGTEFEQALIKELRRTGCSVQYDVDWDVLHRTDFVLEAIGEQSLNPAVEVQVTMRFDDPEKMDAFLKERPVKEGNRRVYFEAHPNRSFGEIAPAFLAEMERAYGQMREPLWIRFCENGKCQFVALEERIRVAEQERDKKFASRPRFRGFIARVFKHGCLIRDRRDPQLRYWASTYHLTPELLALFEPSRGFVKGQEVKREIPVTFVYDRPSRPYPRVARVWFCRVA